MALDVATLPLILYIVRYIHIEHVLHCENIIHIPTLFYYFAIPTPFFSFPMFFLLVIYNIIYGPVIIIVNPLQLSGK